MQYTLFDDASPAAIQAGSELAGVEPGARQRTVHRLGRQQIIEIGQFLDAEIAQRYYERLAAEVPWRQDSLSIAGRRIPVPRLQCWMGESHCAYAYSGIALSPEPWIEPVAELRKALESLTGHDYNCVLINLYRDGKDSVSWHADDEPQLGASPRVASLSLGGVRKFQLKPKPGSEAIERDPEGRATFTLSSGSLLIMQPGVQENWIHQVPKTARPVAPRINLTFRAIAP